MDARSLDGGQLTDVHRGLVDQPEKQAEIPAKESNDTKRYSLKDDSIVLPSNVESKVSDIAKRYYAKTNKTITVTSGTRTSTEQADEMYDNIVAGDTLSKYKDKEAAASIKKAYDDGVVRKEGKATVVEAMAKVITDQISKGVYISKHLISGAVDIRSSDMSEEERAHFKQASIDAGITPLLETERPHWHLQVN